MASEALTSEHERLLALADGTAKAAREAEVSYDKTCEAKTKADAELLRARSAAAAAAAALRRFQKDHVAPDGSIRE